MSGGGGGAKRKTSALAPAAAGEAAELARGRLAAVTLTLRLGAATGMRRTRGVTLALRARSLRRVALLLAGLAALGLAKAVM